MYMPQGIRCNVIAPGGIKTAISSSMGMPNMNGYGRVSKVLGCAPEAGEAEDIANADDPELIEQIAREELGMVVRDEKVFYHIG